MDQRSPFRRARWTSLVFAAGTLSAAACLLIGLLLRAGGGPADVGDPLSLDEIVASAAAIRPWGWSMLGVLLLLATPAAGLVATALELRRDEGRVAWLALAVLAVLGLAVAIALH